MAEKTINIAVKREKLIASVKKAIESREKQLDEHNAITKENDEARAEWLNSIKARLGEPISVEIQRYNNRVTVYYDLPAGLVEPTPKSYEGAGYVNREELESLKNGLVLLEMSEEEVIKTASYGSISKYL